MRGRLRVCLPWPFGIPPVERDPMLFEPSLLLFPRDVNRIGLSMAASVQRQHDADIDKNGFRSLFSIQIGKSIYKANQ
jgi:hypothetical protein